MQRKRAHDHQRTFRIIITSTATARNIRLMEGTIITSHTGIAYHVEHNAQGTPPHHDSSPLISVECAYVEYYPWVYCTRWHVSETAYGPVAEISVSVQNPRVLAAK